jgi:SAM-dependent methyltransferase
MTAVFGAEYAAAYDLLYQDKDYLAECDVIERVFKMYGQGPIRRVLDLGCGTGGHAVPLAERGYEVVGVDRSEAMLEHARRRYSQAIQKDRPGARASPARFEQGELGSLELGQRFEAVLMMFAVLSYQIGNADVLAALASARRHLQPGGLLFFDAWYGPAVLHARPSDRVKVIDLPDGQIIRLASGYLDTRRQACTVRYRVWRIEQQRVVSEVTEHHPMRFFFPLELELLLGASGLEPLRLGCFPDIESEPDASSWNVAVVARAV